MKFLSNSLKVTFVLMSILFLNGCSNDEESDKTTANIEGVWQLGRMYGTANYSGTRVNLEGDSEGTMEFKSDGTYDSNIISGYITISIPAMSYSETTPIDAATTTGEYFYDQTTDNLEIDGEMSKVVVLNANYMKIKTLINDSGVTGELFSEYHR